MVTLKELKKQIDDKKANEDALLKKSVDLKKHFPFHVWSIIATKTPVGTRFSTKNYEFMLEKMIGGSELYIYGKETQKISITLVFGINTSANVSLTYATKQLDEQAAIQELLDELKEAGFK